MSGAAAGAQAVCGPVGDWLTGLRRYLGASLLGHLVWEAGHMPLYTLAWEEPLSRVVLYGLHCTAGDLLIALSALVVALLLLRARDWPARRLRPVALLAGAIGLLYTLSSETVNVEILGSWSYTEAMPRLPFTEIGLTPVLQWLVVPALAFWWVARGRRDRT